MPNESRFGDFLLKRNWILYTRAPWCFENELLILLIFLFHHDNVIIIIIIIIIRTKYVLRKPFGYAPMHVSPSRYCYYFLSKTFILWLRGVEIDETKVWNRHGHVFMEFSSLTRAGRHLNVIKKKKINKHERKTVVFVQKYIKSND